MYPYILTTDRGTQFTAKFWSTMATLLGIKHSFSTAYHPQTDGQTEIVNQWLEQYIRLYCDFDQSNWSHLLYHAKLCYNTTQHRSTGVPPLRALTGVDPRTSPIDNILHQSPLPIPSSGKAPLAIDRIREILELRTFLRGQIEQAQDAQARAYNKKRRDHTFSVGDKVKLSTKNIRTLRPSKKFDARSLGPLTITEVINRNAYRLDIPSTYRIHNVFHISLLSPWKDEGQYTHFDNLPTATLPIPNNPLQIEAILDTRTENDTSEFLVRWLNRPPSDDSWESESTLQSDPAWDRLLRQHNQYLQNIPTNPSTHPTPTNIPNTMTPRTEKPRDEKQKAERPRGLKGWKLVDEGELVKEKEKEHYLGPTSRTGRPLRPSKRKE